MSTTTIQRATSRGQITLPAWWRKQFDTNNYLLRLRERIIEIQPVDVQELCEEEIIFDADRDNNGKGLPPEAFIKALKRIDG
jgi:bifunctional DNA-binding transcriptional regulator/antitoxin component of YhaV-PrlF toxin-antitoxin module